MSLMSLLNKKVNIIRVTKTVEALGGWTEVENILHLNLPCRINWKRGSEKIFFDKDAYFRDAKLYCRVIDVANLTVKDRVQYNGRTYEIVEVSNVDEANRLLVLDIKLVE